MQGALITSDNNNKLYLETYLIDTSITKKNKKVSDQTIDSNVLQSKGHPLTLYPRQVENNWIWDHPVIETNSLGQNIELQKKYTIGNNIRLKKVKDGYWNAVYEITDEGAKKLLAQYEGKTIPFYTSTGIIHNSSEDPLNIADWRIIHNAIVSEPANGFQRAAMVDMCQGTEQTCSTILTASTTDFHFCTNAALASYISSLSSSSGNSTYYTMSSETSSVQVTPKEQPGAPITYNQGFSGTNAQTGLGSVPASLTPSAPPEQFKQQSEQTEVTKKDETDYKTVAEQLKAELKQLKADKEAKENENKTLTERLLNLEKENSRNNRKNQVFSILQQYPEAFIDVKTGSINQQEYSKVVLEWIDKGYDDKTIQELLEAKVIKAKSQLQTKQNDQLKQVYSSLTTNDTPSYQTTAMSSSTNEDSSLPIWEKVFDLTNAKIRQSADKYQKLGVGY